MWGQRGRQGCPLNKQHVSALAVSRVGTGAGPDLRIPEILKRTVCVHEAASGWSRPPHSGFVGADVLLSGASHTSGRRQKK